MIDFEKALIRLLFILISDYFSLKKKLLNKDFEEYETEQELKELLTFREEESIKNIDKINEYLKPKKK